MALFNKLFTNRRNAHSKHQDNVSEKFFAFTKDQVRVVLFRECDFRGRKLLFDSSSVKKVPLVFTKSGEIVKSSSENEKFSEISNGYGYVYTKPQPDFNQLAEMVFGSVAMSFRGTYFKMHCLESPNRLMFTQVFSSPRPSGHGRVSVSSRSDPHTLEHSKLDDSGASSTNSMSEHLSVHSTASDTVLVCRRHHSTPLDVPVGNVVSTSIPSLIGDSGYSADHSYTNVSSGPPSISTWGSIDNNGASTMSLSSSSLYKKWLRRASTSLDNSGQSLATNSGSAQDGEQGRPHHRSSKLGLAFILQLTAGQDEELSQFFMEHVSLLEAMLWRARRITEIAYVKSQNFASLMMEMAQSSAQYLVSLLSGSYLSINLWLSLSSGCDNCNSISAFSASVSSDKGELFEREDLCISSNSLSSSYSGPSKDSESSGEFQFFNLTKFLKTDPFKIKKNLFGDNNKNLTAERFVQDFCELLEVVDVKDTNFFMSTLLTAVLTYHLGWVNTCLPPSSVNGVLLQPKTPFNPLWGELSDLYGAVGHPTKMAQTIVTGSNKKDLISKILVTMTYFIRCCDVDRRVPIRADVENENKIVDGICSKYSCIPKENYKKYEDHLKEIMNLNKEFLVNCQNNNNSACKNHELENYLNENKLATSTVLTKSKTFLGNLSDLTENDTLTCLYPEPTEESKVERKTPCPSTLQISRNITDKNSFSEEEMKKANTLHKVANSAILCCMDKTGHSVDSRTPGTSDSKCWEQTRDVVFVLGENEQLVGIKKDNKAAEKKVECSVKRRPSYLHLQKQAQAGKSTNLDFKDSDFIENFDKSMVKPSTSFTSLVEKDLNYAAQRSKEGDCSGRAAYVKKFSRSQSEPPENRKPEDSKSSKSKYRYSGVKFNLQQYPQILSNYMKSKDLEISNLHFGDKSLKLDELSSFSETLISKYPEIEGDYDEGEALQTPSNASELEFTSDTFVAPPTISKVSEVDADQHKKGKVCDDDKTERGDSSATHKMKVTNLPMPKSKFYKPMNNSIGYTCSLMRAASDSYLPDMVLQGPVVPKQEWESKLRSDLALASQHSLIDQAVEEAVAVVANTDTWDVHLVSSHTFIIDKGSTGIRIGMSQLVANMLESLLQMWKLNVPPHFCLMHIEQTLQELFIRSKALAELLLATEFCNMEQLTSTLQLEVNDVPLLLAVASTHSPQVTQKYGLSFQ